MRLNADFSQPVTVSPDDYEWVSSPASGVERMMLDRIGEEVARATTIVRFAPDSQFDAHTHDGGEEYLVLEGVFSDESGDYPAGTYVRNPIGTSHTPRVGPGCTIFVKLHQFAEDDLTPVVIDTKTADFGATPVAGLSILQLHKTDQEDVSLRRFEPGTRVPHHGHPGGEEILVLGGVLQDESGRYPAGTWIRSPVGSAHAPFSDEGCLIYVKSGHLSQL